MTNEPAHHSIGSDFYWNLSRYHQAIECGVFTTEDRIELLNGRLVNKSKISTRHAACVSKLNRYFYRRYLDEFELISQNPVFLPDWSEPEPDFTIANIHELDYLNGHPGPNDIHVIVEVADKTVRKDRTHKASIYANAGINEYWIINLKQDQIELHLDPDTEEGAYGKIVRYKRGTSFDSPFAGSVFVDDLLPGA